MGVDPDLVRCVTAPVGPRTLFWATCWRCIATDSLGLVEAGSVEEVISSVADLQLTKFMNFKNLFNTVNLLLYGCAPGGRVCY